jgi:DNA (cytosine-5)-methyltransferase 1
MTLAIGSLFSGSGMLDEAVRSVLGGEVVWHAEHEPPTEKNPTPTQAAARVLAYRYPGVPNLGDISTVDWSTVPPIDILTGGFPCQDVSHAGRRAGMTSGTRSGLWARMCDAIEVLRPAQVVIENVRGLSSACADSEMGRCPRCVGGTGPHDPVLRALGRVLGDLAELGYDTQWVGLPASDIGAPHERFRHFVLAQDADGPTRDQRRIATPGQAEGRWPRPDARRSGGASTAHAERGGRDGWARDQIGRPFGRAATAGAGQDAAADAHRNALRLESVTERRGGGTALAGHTVLACCGDRLDQHLPDRCIGQRWDGRGCPCTAHLVSHPEGIGRREGRTASAGVVGRPDAAECGAPTPADPDSDGLERVRRQFTIQRDTHRRDSADIAWGDYEPAIRRWEHVLGRPAPAPTETGTRGGQRLSRWFDEWMMGWPDGWVTDVPGITYREAIKICGNGVVPQQAAAALRFLLDVAERAA